MLTQHVNADNGPPLAKIITIIRTKDLNYFSLCAFNLFNTRVSQFELKYWNKLTFPRHSNLLIYTCTICHSFQLGWTLPVVKHQPLSVHFTQIMIIWSGYWLLKTLDFSSQNTMYDLQTLLPLCSVFKLIQIIVLIWITWLRCRKNS